MVPNLGYEQKKVIVHCNSQSAICLSANRKQNQKTKHIDIKLHFIRFEVSRGVVKLVKMHTNENLPDMLTKVVLSAKFEFYLNSAGSTRFRLQM